MRIDARDFAKQIDPTMQALKGAIRRMAITLTTKALWQLAGFRQADGTTETRMAEVFSGIGFYARPPSSGSPEAVVTMLGADSASPVVVATRDEATRAAVAGGLAADETMVFTSQAVVYVKADGTIEIRSHNGSAQSLATNADLAAILSVLKTWTPVANDGGAALKTAILALVSDKQVDTPNWPIGTTKIKGE